MQILGDLCDIQLDLGSWWDDAHRIPLFWYFNFFNIFLLGCTKYEESTMFFSSVIVSSSQHIYGCHIPLEMKR